ncbi:uncharacterized protein At4g00950-like [Gastrolobium bilobum]|uniref:uncharacterized protein At4g00950-like n=1 Tax=Gastrolobium bilobum TaxID=150636 RepID=UPI002AB2047F|nr:uncharacterized protein At4g00950-like [Gastrolobium bilobum]
MGCEAEAEEHSKIPMLPLFSIPTIMQSPERSGMLTPPLHTSAAVPFRWEQEPGKPRPCNALVTFSKGLELPPRLLAPSLLEGSFVTSNRFRSPSFRKSNNCYGSFSADRGLHGAMVLTKGEAIKDKGWFCSWRKKGFKVNREVTGGSHVFPSSTATFGDTHNKVNRSKMKRSGSFSSSLSHNKSRVWTTICEGLKQVVPWSRKKPKKNGSGLRL